MYAAHTPTVGASEAQERNNNKTHLLVAHLGEGPGLLLVAGLLLLRLANATHLRRHCIGGLPLGGVVAH